MAEQNVNANQEAPKAQIKSGVYSAENAAAVGKTIAEVRGMFQNKFNIPDGAAAFNGKQRVDEDYVVREGDQIQFSRVTGEKG